MSEIAEIRMTVTGSRQITVSGHKTRDHLLLQVGDDPTVEVQPEDLIAALEMGADFLRRKSVTPTPEQEEDGARPQEEGR